MSVAPDRKRALAPLVTHDGRYIVVRGRLWRTSNPGLSEDDREGLVKALMDARREVRDALRKQDVEAEAAARRKVDAAKVGLGERGPVWWNDGGPDLNRHLVRNTPYAKWHDGVSGEGRGKPSPAPEPASQSPPSRGD